MPTRHRILGVKFVQAQITLLTVPSAVHLTTCFSPDSQHHRLSVKASLPLSPLQQFDKLYVIKSDYRTNIFICQVIFFMQIYPKQFLQNTCVSVHLHLTRDEKTLQVDFHTELQLYASFLLQVFLLHYLHF